MKTEELGHRNETTSGNNNNNNNNNNNINNNNSIDNNNNNNDDNNNNNVNNGNKNVLDETAWQAAVEKTKLEIELQNKIWKWKTSNNFKGFTIKKKHEIFEEDFLREKQKK